MFVLRSIFWLIVGFVLVAPHGTDFGAVARQAGDQAIATATQAGEHLLVSQVLPTAQLSAALPALTASTPSVDLTMQGSPTAPIVFPRPRPAAMG